MSTSTMDPARLDLPTVASLRIRGAHRFAGPAVSALMAAGLSFPVYVVVLLGTPKSFIVGYRNVQTCGMAIGTTDLDRNPERQP